MARCDLCDHAEVCGWRKDMKEQGCEHYCEHTISVPIGATNGEVIKALFPKWEQLNNNSVWLNGDVDDHTHITYTTDWWNAPYKEG